MISFRRRLTLLAAVATFAASQLAGQSTTSLHGDISDGAGAMVVGAVVTITNPKTGFTRQTTSDNTGQYQLPQIPSGTYDIRVEQPGFRVATRNGIDLLVNTPTTVNMQLEVGSVTETVNVMAEAPALNSVDASVGNAFTQTQVRQLPLLTRNVVELLSLQPGVTQSGEVMGAKRDQNNITLDGVDANDNQNSGISAVTNQSVNGSNANGVPGTSGFNAALPVPLDSVETFRVTVGGMGANQGRSSGGQVTLITKSGSNAFHGSLYEYNRNTATAANDWFSNRAGVARQPLVRNQFGASVGGRIIRDRLFFFANWENRIDASGQAVTRTVPSDTLRQGILTLKTSAGIQTLTPAEVKTVDPLGIGSSPTVLDLFSKYPVGNDPQAGADKGLNFSGYRFNAPFKENDKAYVAKIDYIVTQNQTLSLRGTLADNSQDAIVAQFPGQAPAARLLNNSRGLSAVYNTVLRPTLINTFTFGLTRIGLNQAGSTGYAYTFDTINSLGNYNASARGFVRIAPVYNLLDDVNWTKGRHTLTAGVNARFVRNDKSAYSNSFPAYSFSRNTLLGLGGDITPVLTSYLAQRTGNSGLSITDATNAVRGLGNMLGLVNQYSVTYNFDSTGTAIPIGNPVARSFASNDYEFYVQDAFRIRRDLTLTYGLRYSLFGVPYEQNGVEVVSTVGVNQYFAERVAASQAGVPGYMMPNASLTYALAGPANGKPGWYGLDKNNFAPRLALAYSPDDGLGAKLLGKGSVLRAGFAVVYDHYGTDMITNLDSTGSPGLATSVTQPVNTNFTTATRYINGALPALPTAPQGAFPFTPPTIVGGFGAYVSISPDLVAPYSYMMNATYGRQLPGKMTLEVGYMGRLGHKELLQQDTFQPLTQFRDPASGQTWSQAATVLRKLADAGLTPAQVKADPTLAGKVPFIENMFPALTNLYITGSATANYFDAAFRQNDGSQLDALNQMDRGRSAQFPNCIVRTGCNTFFPLQNAGNKSWVNAGNSSFHAMLLTLRRQYSNGLSFDFNYTLSSSMDTSSAPESGAGASGAVIQDSFNPGAFRGPSDFDARHQINANLLYELPFGPKKMFFNHAPGFVNQIIGGWQISLLSRYRSGLPTTITYGGLYPTNYLTSALGILAPGAAMPANGVGYDQNGAPSIFRNTNASGSFIEQYPGGTGTRGIVRLAPMTNFDIALGKSFAMPWENHRVQFRAEAFNAFNNVNFYNPNLSLSSTTVFGEFQNAMPARVMQFALRYEF